MPSSSRNSSNGSIRTFESEPTHNGIPRVRTRSAGRKPSPRSASVVGQTQIVAPTTREDRVGTVGVGRVHDGRVLRQAAGAGEQLDRSAAVLGEALLDLLRLLVGMDVQRKIVLRRVAADLLEPVGRAGPNRVGCDADGDPGGPQLLDLLEILGHGGLSEAGETAARVGDVEEDERRFQRRLRPPRPRGPRRYPGSGTRRRPCIPRRASRGMSARTPPAPSRASAGRHRRASSRARPRSRLPQRSRGARAGTCGCGRSRSRGVAACPPRGRR